MVRTRQRACCPLPSASTFVSATPSQGSAILAGSNLFANIGSLLNGASATITLVITPTAVGSITNSASVRSDDVDNTPGDDSAMVTTPVGPPPGKLEFAAATSSSDETNPSVALTVKRV